jgi:TonB family protein
MTFGPPPARMRQQIFPPPIAPADPQPTNGASIQSQLPDARSRNDLPNNQSNDLSSDLSNDQSNDMAMNALSNDHSINEQSRNALSQEEIVEAVLKQYLTEVKYLIKKRWLAPRGNVQIRVVVLFRLHRAGDISQLRLQLSSGSSYIDMTALKAVEMAVYFPKIPDVLPEFLDMQFVFEYGFDKQKEDEVRTSRGSVMPPKRAQSGYAPSLELPASTD